MIVLGIGTAAGEHNHDSSAAIVVDGQLLVAAEEERFTRVKHDASLPLNSIEFCLSHAGISMSDVDFLALPERPYRTGRDSELAWADARSFRELVDHGLVRPRSYWHKRLLDVTGGRHWPSGFSMSTHVSKVLESLRDVWGALPPFRFFGHHQSHAAAAFYLSGFDDSAVITADGRGGIDSTVIWHGNGKKLRQLFAQNYVDSLGHFYMHCTMYLGLGEFAEGKTMGLASYGEPSRFQNAVEAMLQVEKLPFRYLQRPSESILGFPARGREEIMQAPYADFAAAAQRAVETTMKLLAQSAIKMVGSRNVCLGGGVALNCSANGRLHNMDGLGNLFVFPAAGDAGLSVGAALLAAAAADEPVNNCLDQSYFGPACTQEQIEGAVSDVGSGIRVRRNQPPSMVAELIAQGAVVGWVQGRMEFGPRALGGRSILADPRSTKIRDRVNRLKRRELWRPLAPMILEERAADYFETIQRSRFMLLAVPVRLDRRADIGGVVHVDGSARPQTVPRDGPPRLRRLLESFDAITGVPVLLNTSFNSAGEPIVCTPADAIRSFLQMGLDALVIEDWIIEPLTTKYSHVD